MNSQRKVRHTEGLAGQHCNIWWTRHVWLGLQERRHPPDGSQNLMPKGYRFFSSWASDSTTDNLTYLYDHEELEITANFTMGLFAVQTSALLLHHQSSKFATRHWYDVPILLNDKKSIQAFQMFGFSECTQANCESAITSAMPCFRTWAQESWKMLPIVMFSAHEMSFSRFSTDSPIGTLCQWRWGRTWNYEGKNSLAKFPHVSWLKTEVSLHIFILNRRIYGSLAPILMLSKLALNSAQAVCFYIMVQQQNTFSTPASSLVTTIMTNTKTPRLYVPSLYRTNEKSKSRMTRYLLCISIDEQLEACGWQWLLLGPSSTRAAVLTNLWFQWNHNKLKGRLWFPGRMFSACCMHVHPLLCNLFAYEQMCFCSSKWRINCHMFVRLFSLEQFRSEIGTSILCEGSNNPLWKLLMRVFIDDELQYEGSAKDKRWFVLWLVSTQLAGF